ncbi:MAG: hypothetical protein JSS40_11975 [Proteobacteria bacterium]|nr:hypothetical protein [Pseudomonadota bacterium]
MVDKSAGSGGAQDPFEMFRRLWAPLGLPVPGMAMPTLDPAEVEKRIADLKSVETWLGMNLNMVKMAIQGLEMQKMALDAMKANAGAASDAASAFAAMSRTAAPATGAPPDPANPAANPMANPMLWPWAMMQGAGGQEKPAEPKAGEGKGRKDGKQESK